jgi:hypothetical protein
MPAVLKSVHASRVKERACQTFFNGDVYVEHTLVTSWSLHASRALMVMCMSKMHESNHDDSHDDVKVELNFRVTR